MSQNPVNTTFEYNGFTGYFDIEDVECTERYETAFQNMKEAEKNSQKDGLKSERIKEYCLMLRNFFDDIFPDDEASKKICGEKLNSRTDTEAYNAFLQFVAAQSDAGEAQKTALATTYLNRAQRRQAAREAEKQRKKNGNA